MGRRKRVLDDGDDSDSSMHSGPDFDNDPDAREERELFENPYRKRRRTNGKEDALYGVFAANSDDENHRPREKQKRADWAKAPAFVSGDQPVKLDDVMQIDSDVDDADGNSGSSSEDDDASEGGDEANSDESESFRAPPPRIQLEDDLDRQSVAADLHPTIGLGARASTSFKSISGASAFSKGGIGSKPFTTATEPATVTPTAESSHKPSAFSTGSFLRQQTATSKPVPLPATEMAHFQKISGSFGAKMLAKMGWQAGAGLGVAGEGIVTPIESKLRPQKMGIAFKGFKEKTEQSKIEAKRRGEAVSDDEGDLKTKRIRRKARDQAEKRSEAWKRPKKTRTRVEHKTYEQILAETGEESQGSGLGQIIDATGAVPREVSSLADINLNSWAPSNDPTRIPEVRHNIRLITDACKSDLDGLAREAKALKERGRFVISEDTRLRKRVEDEAELISRLQQVQLVAADIEKTAKELASLYEVSLEPFSLNVQLLINQYPREYERYRLDEIVVAAIAPAMRRMVNQWNPLENPAYFLSTFRLWRKGLRINEEQTTGTELGVYGTETERPVDADKPMTPFESLLWTVWLPRVRASINNDWLPEEPQTAVTLYEVWSTFLPPFIRDNLLDQLILPKVQKAVANWSTRKSSVSLHAIVFPWLQHVGLRLEEVLGDARRKIKIHFRSWSVDEPIPTDLAAWRDVFESGDWDSIMLKYVVPKLAAALRNDFQVNPRDQKLEALTRVFAWKALIRPSIFSQILEAEFFPKYLDILHIWLIQPGAKLAEVADWHRMWTKDIFPEEVRAMPGVDRGFMRALQLMNQAIELGPEAPKRLPRPDYGAEVAATHAPNPSSKPAQRASVRTHEITFKSIVEEYAATHNLLILPTGLAHEKARMPLFRVGLSVDGKKGLFIYILDDAVWAPSESADATTAVESLEFRAIGLEDMVKRAML